MISCGKGEGKERVFFKASLVRIDQEREKKISRYKCLIILEKVFMLMNPLKIILSSYL